MVIVRAMHESKEKAAEYIRNKIDTLQYSPQIYKLKGLNSDDKELIYSDPEIKIVDKAKREEWREK